MELKWKICNEEVEKSSIEELGFKVLCKVENPPDFVNLNDNEVMYILGKIINY